MSLENPKLKSLSEACYAREVARARGERFVLTNGCFDLLHPGHVAYLQNAAEQGEHLWVLLNSDQSVRLLKGPARPIMLEDARAFMLNALQCVSGITLFHTLRLDAQIRELRPDIYVKAGDYTLEKLDPQELAALQSCNSRIEFMPFIPGYSTTGLIKQITELEQ